MLYPQSSVKLMFDSWTGQDLIDAARNNLITNRALLCQLQARAGLPVSDANDPVYTSFVQVQTLLGHGFPLIDVHRNVPVICRNFWMLMKRRMSYLWPSTQFVKSVEAAIAEYQAANLYGLGFSDS